MRNPLISIFIALMPLVALSRPLSLVVSIPPQQEAVRAIAGNDAIILLLVPKGASPETYSPSAAEIRRLSNADILFTIGVPIEKAIIPKIRQINKKIHIADTKSQMILRDMEGGHHGHSHGAKDPHVWLSIENMIVHAQNVAKTLAEKDAENAADYTSRANDYIASLKKLQSELANAMKHLAGGKLMVFHPAFGYFLDQCGMTQIPVELDGHEPTGKHLAALTNIRNSTKAMVLITQPQSNKVLAESVAKTLALKTVIIDPLPDDYSNGMRNISNAIVDACYSYGTPQCN